MSCLTQGMAHGKSKINVMIFIARLNKTRSSTWRGWCLGWLLKAKTNCWSGKGLAQPLRGTLQGQKPRPERKQRIVGSRQRDPHNDFWHHRGTSDAAPRTTESRILHPLSSAGSHWWNIHSGPCITGVKFPTLHPFYRWENWGSRNRSHLPKNTHLFHDHARTQTQGALTFEGTDWPQYFGDDKSPNHSAILGTVF